MRKFLVDILHKFEEKELAAVKVCKVIQIDGKQIAKPFDRITLFIPSDKLFLRYYKSDENAVNLSGHRINNHRIDTYISTVAQNHSANSNKYTALERGGYVE